MGEGAGPAVSAVLAELAESVELAAKIAVSKLAIREQVVPLPLVPVTPMVAQGQWVKK